MKSFAQYLLYFPSVFSLLLFVYATNIDAASLQVSPATGNFTLNQEFDVNIILDTENEQITGTDVTLKYDPLKLEVVSLTPGTIFGNYPIKSASSGVITFTGIITTGSQTGYSGIGTFGTVKLKVIQTGTTTLDFDFTKGAVADSNVVSTTSGQDLLSSVANASFILTPASIGATTTTSEPAVSDEITPVVTGDDLETGSYNTGLVVFGFILVVSSLVYIFKQDQITI
jgi:hypothetical protein